MAQTSLPRNNDELKSYMTIPLYKVVDYVAQQIYQENKKVVLDVVYGAGIPEVYERTYQLKNDAWDIKNVKQKSNGNLVEKEFTYNPDGLQIDRGKAQHGSPESVKNYQDICPYLVDIIYQGQQPNKGMLFGDGYWRKKRDAWKKLLNTLGKRKMHKWFKEGFELYGIDYERYANIAIETWDDNED